MTPTKYVSNDNIKEDIVISGIRDSDFDGKFFNITLGDICVYLGNKKKCRFCIRALIDGKEEFYGYLTFDDYSTNFSNPDVPNFSKTYVCYLTNYANNFAYDDLYCGIVIEATKDNVTFYDLAYYSYDLKDYEFPKELKNRTLKPCLFLSMTKMPDTKG